MDSRISALTIFFALFISIYAPTVADFTDYDEFSNLISDMDSGGFRSLFDTGYQRADTTQENCSARSIYEFPTDLFTRQQRKQGAVVLHFFCGFYTFLMVAIICNDYFLPSVDCICTDLRISKDVAAATFMATATCSPELFVNIIGTFLTESDLGIGAVIGSGVFNTFGVAACGGLAAIKGIQMEWWPLTRDSLIYSISIILLTVMMWDGSITWRESMILMICYVLYFVFLFCDKIISRWAHSFVAMFKKDKTLAETPDKDTTETFEIFGTYRPYFHGELVIEYRNSITRSSIAKVSSNGNAKKAIQVDVAPLEEYVEPDTPFTIPKGSRWEKIWWFFLWPLRFLLFISIPDCRYKKLRRFYPVTFIMCIIWIAVTSYIVSWMITVLGDTIGIADAVMGLTFLAAGGSLPEAVSSVIMARQGQGEMGLSNSIGANTLDILLCLGLPWLIKTATGNTTVEIVSSTITYSFLALVGTVVLLWVLVAMNSFQLNKKIGGICLILYAAFLSVSVLLEMNVFFFVNWPMCDPTD